MKTFPRFWLTLPQAVILSLVSGLGILMEAHEAAGQQPPSSILNIVLIVADDHGQDTGAYGNPVIRTPNLDRLAAEGTMFSYAFATTASCSASRSVILTGLHNHRTAQYGHEHSVHHFRSYEDLKSLPVLLAEVGYRTARIGKYHVGPEAVYHFHETIPGPERNPVQMAENVRRFIVADRRPFFLYFATSDPHRSGDPSVADTPAQSAAAIGRPDTFGNRAAPYRGVQEVAYRPEDVIVPAWLPDRASTRAELAEYYQSVSRLDQGVGRLVQTLKDAGVYDNTLIVYMSDHGAAFAGAKTTVYEPGLLSPLIVRHPHAPRRGVRSNAMISWVDITPTLVAIAGAQAPTYGQRITLSEILGQVPAEHSFHGRSFLPIMWEENPIGWDEVNASHTFHEVTMYYPMRVVRDRKYKLIWNLANGLSFPFASDLWSSSAWQGVFQERGMDAMYGVRTAGEYIRRPAFELYDMEKDPNESVNLAADSKYAAVLQEYMERIRTFQQRTSDPWLVEWGRP
jgi:N-sulfoglucosamine sulfohydrolase